MLGIMKQSTKVVLGTIAITIIITMLFLMFTEILKENPLCSFIGRILFNFMYCILMCEVIIVKPG